MTRFGLFVAIAVFAALGQACRAPSPEPQTTAPQEKRAAPPVPREPAAPASPATDEMQREPEPEPQASQQPSRGKVTRPFSLAGIDEALRPVIRSRRVTTEPAAPPPAPALTAAPEAPTIAAVPEAPAPAPVRNAEPASFAPGIGEEPAPLASGESPAQVVRASDFRPTRLRHADIQNDLQFGPDRLVVDRLVVTADVQPESLQASLIYRFATDESATRHHLFGLGVQSPRCEGECMLRWFAQAGFAPDAGGSFVAARRRNQLYWYAVQAAAGASVMRAPFTLGVDGQLEYLDVEYRQGSARSAMVADTLSQVRLRAVVGTEPGPGFGFKAIAGTYLYPGRDPRVMSYVPIRGVLIEDDLPGLAGAMQSMTARAEGRWESRRGFAIEAGYSFLTYSSTLWSTAHIGSLSASQRLGPFRVGIGIAAEQEVDTRGRSFGTYFGTGRMGASF